jgi:hypothetical protein
MVTSTVRGGWLGLALLMGAGCGGGGAPAPVPVKGTVTLDGKPLADATVQFVAQDAGGRDATGTTNAEGAFALSTVKPGDGALPGKYKVVIQPPAPVNGGAPAASMEDAQKGVRDKSARGIPLPDRYTRADLTVLTQDVPAAGPVVFELTSK